MDLEKKLISLRKKQGLSQQELADRLNVSRQAVSKWERGQALPSAENLAAMSRLLDVPMDALLDGGAPPIRETPAENAAMPEAPGVPQKAGSGKPFPVRFAAAGVLLTVFLVGLLLGAFLGRGGAGGFSPMLIDPVEGSHIVAIRTKRGMEIVEYKKSEMISQDWIEPEQIDMSQVDDSSDGWTITE